jgi:putative membrane protein
MTAADGGLRPLVVVYLKGLAMGAADAVPGVSGGTIALITGIYERLITAITNLDPAVAGDLLAAVGTVDADRVRATLVEVDALFLAALGFGIVTALVTVASLVADAVASSPVPTFGFFLGLIAASAVVLWRGVTVDTPQRYAAAAVGFVLAFVLSGSATASFGHGPVVTFLTGVVAVSAMILPGISGSLILLILGQYVHLTGALKSVRDGVLAVPSGGDPGVVVAPATTAVVFVAGALVGLVTISHVVRWALSTRRQATLAFLIALVAGALRAPIVRIEEALGGEWTAGALGLVAVTALAGALVVFALEYLGGGPDAVP